MHQRPTDTPLRLDVALTLADLAPEGRQRRVFVVVDVIRATTTLCVLFERGCRRALVAPDIATARDLRGRRAFAEYLLAGEVGGVAPPGFDLGNSPAEVAEADLAGRSVLFATTNGTRALAACAGGGAIFAGAFRNARAVAAAALAAHAQLAWLAPTPDADDPARRALLPSALGAGAASEATLGDEEDIADVVFVCSGRTGHPAYDDTLCAGYLAREFLRQADASETPCLLGEGVRVALAVAEDGAATRARIREALAISDAAAAIRRVGLAGDLDFCADVDATALVPTVVGREAGTALPVIEAYEEGNGVHER